jgi:hypothetical protein
MPADARPALLFASLSVWTPVFPVYSTHMPRE